MHSYANFVWRKAAPHFPAGRCWRACQFWYTLTFVSCRVMEFVPGPRILPPPVPVPLPPSLGQAQDADGLSSVQLQIRSIHCNLWGTLNQMLSDTLACVVIAQEHRFRSAEALYQASQWCSRHGWKSLWCPALCTETDSTSAGL